MGKIEAVIFDWAGTTVDFGSCAPVVAFIEAFKKFGVEPTLEEVRKPMGILKWNHIDTMMKMPRIAAEWEKAHGRAATKEDVEILHNFAEPKPFVLDTIASLRARGIKIGATTGFNNRMMSIVVPKAKENGYAPDYWCTPNAVNDIGRPYPYMIHKNFAELGLQCAANVIKVGDSIADIKEGNNAGLVSVGIVEGSSTMGLTEAELNT